jgi:hypothetical protein
MVEITIHMHIHGIDLVLVLKEIGLYNDIDSMVYIVDHIIFFYF